MNTPTTPTRQRSRLLRYSLRSLLIAITIGGILLGLWVRSAERQRKAVAKLTDAGARVWYGLDEMGKPRPWLATIIDVIGIDYVSSPISVALEMDDSDASLIYLRDLPPLEALYLQHTDISGKGLETIRTLPHLAVLNLSDTNIDDTALMVLHDMTSLRHLSVTGTAVTDKGIAELQQALPRCRIHR